MKYYSVINGYFRFEKLWRNRYITRDIVAILHYLLDNIIICLYEYVDLASKLLIKMHARKEPLAINRAPLAIGLLLHHWLKERTVKGSIYCICKNQSQNSVFQPYKNFHFDTSSSVRLIMAGCIVN